MVWDLPVIQIRISYLQAVSDHLTKETLAAIDAVKTEAPEIKCASLILWSSLL